MQIAIASREHIKINALAVSGVIGVIACRYLRICLHISMLHEKYCQSLTMTPLTARLFISIAPAQPCYSAGSALLKRHFSAAKFAS